MQLNFMGADIVFFFFLGMYLGVVPPILTTTYYSSAHEWSLRRAREKKRWVGWFEFIHERFMKDRSELLSILNNERLIWINCQKTSKVIIPNNIFSLIFYYIYMHNMNYLNWQSIFIYSKSSLRKLVRYNNMTKFT